MGQSITLTASLVMLVDLTREQVRARYSYLYVCCANATAHSIVGGQIYWVNSEAKMYCRVCVLKKTNGQPINARDYSS